MKKSDFFPSKQSPVDSKVVFLSQIDLDTGTLQTNTVPEPSLRGVRDLLKRLQRNVLPRILDFCLQGRYGPRLVTP